ncbi:Fe-S cluster assembly protein SufD [Tissierella creatinini]|nr:Fe-S cluster assembly protein SufD [Tissierella creatinini]TJX67296.1 Fe-S cluster assembly protein SufD [Soehngenia saccharolytica]
MKWNRIGLESLTFPEPKKYTKEYLSNLEITNINLDEINELSTTKLEDFMPKEAKGLGKDFTSYVEEYYNSGISLHVPRNMKVEKPIILDFLMDDENPMVIDRNILVLEPNSEITVVINYKTKTQGHCFHNGLTKVYAKENSLVNIIKIQNLNDKSHNFDSNLAIIEGEGNINWVSIELGGNITGSNFTTILNGDASQGNLSSIYLGDGDRKLDLGYSMIHKGRKSNSNIETKGVLMDDSKKVFRGNLIFKKGARTSKGVEGEYVILLDPAVKSDSIPGLFCEEDDVSGEHAASAGQIDKDKLFYLMSRGLSEREAKKLIIQAAFRPVVDKIPSEELRNSINTEIERRIINE